MAVALKYGGFYHCRVKSRRGDGYVVKPEAEPLDGREFVLEPIFRLDAEDHRDAQGRPLYAGEFAMGDPRDPRSDSIRRPLLDLGLMWIASGDLEVLEEIERDDLEVVEALIEAGGDVHAVPGMLGLALVEHMESLRARLAQVTEAQLFQMLEPERSYLEHCQATLAYWDKGRAAAQAREDPHRIQAAKGTLRAWAEPAAARERATGRFAVTPAMLAPGAALLLLRYIEDLEREVAPLRGGSK